MNGFAGKILRVNLTNRTYQEIPTEKYQHWVGGHGIGTAIFFDIVVKEKGIDLEQIDGFSEHNVVTVMSTPLCGSGVPGGSARLEVQGIGVHSAPIGWFTRSSMGGRFAAMLKFAGWDGIVLEGAASTPVWLDIRDNQVTIRDCADLQLWGIDTYQCQQTIWNFVLEGDESETWHKPAGLQDETTQKPAVMAIGAAGENLSRLGAIIHDSGHAAGEGGFGGVWGSKRLKAISVIGSGSVHIANPAALFQTRLWHKDNYQFDLTSKEIEKHSFPSDGIWVPPKAGNNYSFSINPDPEDSEENAFEGSRPLACVGCHSACRARYQSGLANEIKCYTTAFYPYSDPRNAGERDPEKRKIINKQQLEIQRRAAVISNLLGINAHDLVFGIRYLVKLNDAGVLGPGMAIDCPLDFGTIGSLEFIEQLLRAIAYGDDGKGNPSPFGEALKEGFYRAAERWGRLNEDLATGLLSFPHWGLPIHLDPRFQIEWGYSNILSDRDVCEHDFDFLHKNPTEAEANPLEEPLVTAAEGVRIYTEKMTPYNELPKKERMRMLDYSERNMYSLDMARLVAWFRHYTRFYKRAAGFCDWQYPDFVNPYAAGKVGSTGEAEPRYINAVMGTQMTFLEGIELGRKMWNFDQAIWLLQGRRNQEVQFADYIYEGPNGEYQEGVSEFHFVPCITEVTPEDEEEDRWEYTNVNVGTRKIDRNEFDNFKKLFYQLEGWDASGQPTRATLEQLELSDVADELERRGKLGKP